MLFERIERLRQEPVHVRERYAFLSSIVLTGVIVVVWLGTLILRSGAGVEHSDVTAAVSDADTGRGSISELQRLFRSANTFMRQGGSASLSGADVPSVSPEEEMESNDMQDISGESGEPVSEEVTEEDSLVDDDTATFVEDIVHSSAP